MARSTETYVLAPPSEHPSNRRDALAVRAFLGELIQNPSQAFEMYVLLVKCSHAACTAHCSCAVAGFFVMAVTCQMAGHACQSPAAALALIAQCILPCRLFHTSTGGMFTRMLDGSCPQYFGQMNMRMHAACIDRKCISKQYAAPISLLSWCTQGCKLASNYAESTWRPNV